jgi:hypothetical protein
MARQLLLKSLVSIFGDFVDGLTEENLKVGVSRGCGRLIRFECMHATPRHDETTIEPQSI